MKRHIKAYYVISCEDSNRFHRFDDIDFVEVVKAIDSRTDPIECCETNNFKIDLKEKHIGHYEKCVGAYGCFMSHHYLWEKISSFDDDMFYCILEDDIKLSSLKNFYKLNYCPQKPLVNLNYKKHHGSDAYALNKKMADLLIENCNRTLQYPVDKYLFKYFVGKYRGLFKQDSRISLNNRFKGNRDIRQRK